MIPYFTYRFAYTENTESRWSRETLETGDISEMRSGNRSERNWLWDNIAFVLDWSESLFYRS